MIEGLQNRPAVVLLSGGLDSATTLAVAKAAGFTPYALSVALRAAARRRDRGRAAVARSMGVARHVERTIDLRAFGGSALTAESRSRRTAQADEMAEGIPITYVPARNTVFLALALAWAETLGAFDCSSA